MKKLCVISALLALVLAGCKNGPGFFGKKTGGKGELTGVLDRKPYDNPVPLGMVRIPAGAFHMGQNDQDVSVSQTAPTRQVSISAFYMDDTEITNNEYRQFVHATKGIGQAGQAAAGGSNGGPGYQANIAQFLAQQYFYSGPGTATQVPFNPAARINPAVYEKLIYPDTLSWRRDFTFTYNDPTVENYFWHPGFDEYPVVGVNWYGAQAFSYWRTLTYNEFRKTKNLPELPRFRLPSEAEWEFAARGGLEHKLYPWEGLYLRNSQGCLLANFKNGRGDYVSDGYIYTAPVRSYFPNNYGLYDMSGNASEWCEDDYRGNAYTFEHDANPVYRDERRKNTRRVVRGGSWKDIAYFLSVGTRGYEYAEVAKSYIGFRCVVSIIGPEGSAR